MAEKTLTVRQKQKYDTAANWTSNNPVLLAGELGIESDTNKFKVGDGTTNWSGLSYAGGGGSSSLPSNIAYFEEVSGTPSAALPYYTKAETDELVDEQIDAKGIKEINTQYIRITDLSTGIYKLTYNGTKYIYYSGTSSTSTHTVAGGMGSVILTVNRYGTTSWQWYYINGTTSYPTIYYGYTSSSSGSNSSKALNNLLTAISSYVQNNLTYSTSNTTYALSAYQGYVLKGLVDGKVNSSATSSSYTSTINNNGQTIELETDESQGSGYTDVKIGNEGVRIKTGSSTAETVITSTDITIDGVSVLGDLQTQYVRFPSGLQICWGIKTNPANNGVCNFPIAFLTGTTPVVVACQTGSKSGWNDNIKVNDIGTSSFTVNSGGTASYHWVAIGKWK